MWEKVKEKWSSFRKNFTLTDITSGESEGDKPWFNNAISLIWKAVLISICAFYLILLLVTFDNLPTFEELENPNYNQATLVLANDGTTLGKFYNENREFMLFDSLNPFLIKALLSTEDSRYYQHSGIDFQALMRVMFRTVLLSQDEAGGGSTITQQLAKLLFERPNLKGRSKITRMFMLVRIKLKEWLTAIKLERRYTKEQIIALYLNKFDFIYEAHGIQTASQTYFGKTQDKLKIEEAATLIGMLKNPTLYNPRKFPELAKERRNTVLALMEQKDHISKTELNSLMNTGMDVSGFKRENHVDGLAPYFRAELSKWLKILFADPKYLKGDGSSYNPYEDGLKIYTTIDPVYQKHAEEAAVEHMQNIQKSYFNVWAKNDPWKFEADENQLKIRTDALQNLIRETDRYYLLWQKYFSKVQILLEKEIGDVDVNDRTIQRVLNEEKTPGFLNDELKRKAINKVQHEFSFKILKSKQWNALKKLYVKFDEELKSQMNTPVKMKIYDYATNGDKEVEMSPLDSIKHHRKHLQIGSVAVDPHTGEVKAWVGGTNFKYFKYDHVNSRRQVGSTFKPFVYATAIAFQGIQPCDEFQDIQYTIPANDKDFGLPEAWSPGNAKESFTGKNYNLYNALAESKNSITVRLVMLLGSVAQIRGLLHNMGIDSTARRRDGGLLIPKFPSIVLGSSELSAFEMSGAYTTFANNGDYVKPFFVSKIEDKNGKVIYQNTPHKNQALAPNYNYVMVHLMERSGHVYGVQSNTAGKTGTTNDYVDGWYMGMTPNLVVGTWVGGEDPWIRFLSLETGQGGVMAKPFFAKFLSRLEKDPNARIDIKSQFIRPVGDLGVELNCDLYKSMMPSTNMDNNMLPNGSNPTEDEIFEDEEPQKVIKKDEEDENQE